MSCFTCPECYGIVTCGGGYAGSDNFWEPLPNCVGPDFNMVFTLLPTVPPDAPIIFIFEKENGVSLEYNTVTVDSYGSISGYVPASFLNPFLAGYEGFVKITIRYGNDYDHFYFGPGGDCHPTRNAAPDCLILKVENRKSTINHDNEVSFCKISEITG